MYAVSFVYYRLKKVSRSVASGNTLGGLLDFGARGISMFEVLFVVFGRFDCSTEGLSFLDPLILASDAVVPGGVASE
jgi:hypothetical protein